MKNIVIGADHRGYALKERIKQALSNTFKLTDVGTSSTESVDYPDIAQDVVKKILSGECEKGVLICGSGVGACVAANKFKGIRAAICHDLFSAHQGVEDDDMNLICLGSGVVGESLAVELISTFVNARFKSEEERYVRRLKKIKKIEDENAK